MKMPKINTKMRPLVVLFVAISFVCQAVWLQAQGTGAENLLVQGIPGIDKSFIRGADISSLAQIEEAGGKFFDENGKPVDALVLMKERGVNWIRLRLWHTPVNELPVLEAGKLISNKGQRVGGGTNDLERDIALAKRVKKLGLKLLLDFHYSDFWADPSKQNKPAAWKNLSGKQLEKAVYDYTAATIARFVKEGVRPDMVQIGNETNNGFMWPDGRIWPEKAGDKVGGFAGFIGLVSQAAKAIRDKDPVKDAAKRIQIAIHLADGGRNALYRAIFDPLVAAKVDFDVIGLSFYTYWHGPVSDLSANLADLATRYKKGLVVMETAYAFTTDDGDDFGNSFQVFNGPEGGYLPTVQGQATAFRDVLAAVAAAPDHRGLGGFYWEPAWIPVVGAGWRTGEGDSWENQAMFDFAGKALPSLSVFSRVLGPVIPDLVRVVGSVDPRLDVVVGETPALPARVKGIMNDGSWKWVDCTWDALPASPAGEGTVTASGSVAGSSIAVHATINFIGRRNLIDDPSFEKGSLGPGWSVDDPQNASKVENNAGNARTGSYTFKYWLDKAFVVTLSKTFTDLAPGKYTLVAWGMGGGGEKSIRLGLKSGAESAQAKAVNTGWKKWVRYAVEGLEVKDGSCTISLTIDANAGNWGNFDDFEFYREPDAK